MSKRERGVFRVACLMRSRVLDKKEHGNFFLSRNRLPKKISLARSGVTFVVTTTFSFHQA